MPFWLLASFLFSGWLMLFDSPTSALSISVPILARFVGGLGWGGAKGQKSPTFLCRCSLNWAEFWSWPLIFVGTSLGFSDTKLWLCNSLYFWSTLLFKRGDSSLAAAGSVFSLEKSYSSTCCRASVLTLVQLGQSHWPTLALKHLLS